MAELTAKKRNALPDSAFAVVRTVDGRKERKYPVNDEAHQRAALQRSHQQTATPEEHRAVHAAVGRRDKGMLAEHMREHHGGGKLKRAWGGVVAMFLPQPNGGQELPRAASGATVTPDASYPHAKWTWVRPGQKSHGPFEDRRAAIADLVREMDADPEVIKDAMVLQVFRAHDLLKDALSEATYR